MPSLREIKDRIASVRSTLKITSAMKLVASSKLRKAQRAIEALRPYEKTLSDILALAGAAAAETLPRISHEPDSVFEAEPDGNLVVLAFSSNSSMCGAFNANVIKRTLDLLHESGKAVETWAFGRKMLDALRKSEYPAARDCSHLVAHPSFEGIAEISRDLRTRYESGDISGVVLVYNHFVSTGRQQVVVEPYLGQDADVFSGFGSETEDKPLADDYILEPSGPELLQILMPQVLDLKLYAALLDSAASEHAARMIAMQAATDNAESLLKEITLEYNKGRQQKITSEILDLVGAEA
ncbi:MAG: ATP synthase F1 subunit gamma [Bacteroidales bacterium]|nr:ATP synthase F1 subunit gamma [Bacteroidales bacterium]